MTGPGNPPRQVLVATDLSEPADAALDRAAKVAQEHDARLTAIHVVPPGVDPTLADFARSCLIARTRRYVGDLDWLVTVVRRGGASAEIAAEAAARAVDLVVAGAHGRNWKPEEFAVGGTAEDLARNSRIPVLVVRGDSSRRYRTVLLAVDPSQKSSRAARFGNSMTPEADHIVVHISVVIGEHLLRMRGIDDAALDKLREVSTDRVRSRIELMANELVPPPTGVVIESGAPETSLPELARRHRADLVVVGTGTRSKVGEVILGSVAAHVLRMAPCDVLVVPGIRD